MKRGGGDSTSSPDHAATNRYCLTATILPAVFRLTKIFGVFNCLKPYSRDVLIDKEK